MELGWKVGLLSLLQFPNGGATEIVFVTLFCVAVGTSIAWCGGHCAAMPDGHCLNTAVHCSRGLRVGACFTVSLFSRFPLKDKSKVRGDF